VTLACFEHARSVWERGAFTAAFPAQTKPLARYSDGIPCAGSEGKAKADCRKSGNAPVVPAGLWSFCGQNPQLKLRAIFVGPCGTGESAKNEEDGRWRVTGTFTEANEGNAGGAFGIKMVLASSRGHSGRLVAEKLLSYRFWFDIALCRSYGA